MIDGLVNNIVQPISFGTLAFATSEELDFWKRVYVAAITNARDSDIAVQVSNDAVNNLRKQRKVHH